MDYKEARAKVVKAIIELREFSTTDEMEFEVDNPRIVDLLPDDVRRIMKKLHDENLIKAKVIPESNNTNHLDPYDQDNLYKISIKNMSALIEESNSQMLNYENSTHIYEVVFNEDDGTILLNGDIEFSKPHYDGNNYRLFKALYNNPNIDLSITELVDKHGLKKGTDLDQSVVNLGFRNGFKKVFFSINKHQIKLINPAKFNSKSSSY